MAQEVVKRILKIVTQQDVLTNVPPAQEGFPMREWSLRLYILGPNGEDLDATIFDKVTYKLHPTFTNPNRAVKKPPFLLKEQGWGEFDMTVACHAIDRGGDFMLSHDLNFQKNRYEALHDIEFKNPRPNLAKQLALSGPLPGDEPDKETNGAPPKAKRKAEGDDRTKKKARANEKFDMEKLAAGLQKLGEDDLLRVVQMVHDQKTTDMYIKNDVEQGEFHVDLYTLPNSLVMKLWEFVKEVGAADT